MKLFLADRSTQLHSQLHLYLPNTSAYMEFEQGDKEKAALKRLKLLFAST